MNLKQKFVALVGLPILSLVILVGLGYWTIDKVTISLHDIVANQFLVLIDEEIVPLITDDMLPLINEDVAAIQDLQGSILLMLEADRDVHQAVIAEKQILVASEENEINAAIKASTENIEQARERMLQASKSLKTDIGQNKYNEFVTAYDGWTEKTRKVFTLANTVGKLDFARKASDGGSAFKAFNNMRGVIDELQMIQKKNIEQQLASIAEKRDRINLQEKNVIEKKETAGKMSDEIESQASAMLPLFLWVGIAMSIFVAIVGYMTSRSITKPLTELSGIAKNIATGDIDQEINIKSNDVIGILAESFRGLIDYMSELAVAAKSITDKKLNVKLTPKSDKDILSNSFIAMTANLTEIITMLNDNAGQLVSASTEIASSSEQMSKGAINQTRQITQVSAALGEMSSAISESAKNSSDASDASKNASENAISGGEIIDETISGMKRITDVVKESAQSIEKLADSATQIGEIISVIDDIADQTNLLALNAAIEAARAGEQGRGFAVVADEVRKLAERTGKATSEITNMIKGVQENTKEAVISMESGINEVEKGRSLTDKAGVSLSEIVQVSQKVMDMIRQVSVASEEQSVSAEEITKNMDVVLAVTNETAKGAEQSAAAAEQLSRQAESLKNMVIEFEL